MTYDPQNFPPFAVTVDILVLTIHDERLKVLLIQRDEEPYRGQWALPGGFVKPDEDLYTAAKRVLQNETSSAPARRVARCNEEPRQRAPLAVAFPG